MEEQETKVCTKCGVEKRITLFSFTKDRFTRIRKDVCRSCSIGGLKGDDRHAILKEIYRNYYEFREHYRRTGQDVITYYPETELGSDTYEPLTFSFTELMEGVADLPPRQKQAFFLHIISGFTQKEVALIMGVSMVTVGQYGNQAVAKLMKRYWPEEPEQPGHLLGKPFDS